MSSEREVFLLGAGFSRAISEAMPLMPDLHRDLFPEQGPFSTADLEAWLTYLSEEHPWQSEETALENRARFVRASRRIGAAITERQRAALQEALPSWLGRLVLAWDVLKSHVITLNYDTLVEHAFTMVAPFGKGGRPSHQSLYAIPVTEVSARTEASPSAFQLRGSFRLLKLHGSTNWGYSGAASYFGETIYDVGLRPGWGAAAAEGANDFKLAAPAKVPLIVPPTSSKSSFFANELMRSQWQAARAALASARSLYCLGYSLPATDLEMRFFITSTGTADLVALPVNTDREVLETYQRALPQQRVDARFVTTEEPIPQFVAEWLHSSGVEAEVDELWSRRSRRDAL